MTRDLDEDIQKLADKVAKLEERVSHMDIVYTERIKALEEWVEEHRKEFALEKLGTTKMINKQVWEDIKYRIGQIHERSRKYNGFPSYDFAMLKETIKKVDPEWEPDK